MNLQTKTYICSGLALFCFSALPVYAVSYGTNLIANGNAEAGSSSPTGAQVAVPSWTTTGAFTVIPYSAGNGYPGPGDPGPADRANQFFAGGNNASLSTATQTIDLSANATDINTGNVAYDLSGWFGGFSSDRDHATLTATFFNGATNLGSAIIGPATGSDRGFATGFVLKEKTGRVPVNTTSVVLTQRMIRDDGNSNDGYADSLSLVLTLKAGAATVTNSTFAGNGTRTDATANWSSASHWNPMTVPNNTADNVFNATITGLTLTVPLSPSSATLTRTFGEARVDVDTVVSNLTLTTAGVTCDGFFTPEHSLIVNGTTNDQTVSQSPSLGVQTLGFTIVARNNDVLFGLGNFANFSGTTLTSTRLDLNSQGFPFAILAFNGANVVTLNAVISLAGTNTAITDENGNDALRNLAVIGQSGNLQIVTRNFSTAGNLTINGGLGIRDDASGSSTTFTINGNLTNFDSGTKTLNGSSIGVSSSSSAAVQPTVTLRFNGADIVNNGANLSLNGPNAKILDQSSNDGLRNFAHNLTNGTLFFTDHSFSSVGNFTNDGSLNFNTQNVASSFTINGNLSNFDSGTGTLQSGSYSLFSSSFTPADTATLKFNGANVIHNATTLRLGAGALIRDQLNNDGLRNFVDNQASGVFELDGQSFTAPNDFSNAGLVSINNFGASQVFSVAGGHSYIQTAGETTLGGGSILTAANVFVRGGIVHDGGVINGNVTVESGILAPTGFGGGGTANFQGFLVVVPGSTETPGPADMQINGNLSLQDNAQLSFVINSATAADFDTMEVSGNAHFAGKLAVTLLNGFVPQSSDSFTVLTAGTTITGAFANVASGSRILTEDGRGSFIATYSDNHLILSNFVTEPPHGLLNLSTRMRVLDGDGLSIAGVMITGTDSKKVIIRGIGPSLVQKNLSGLLPDPTLEIHTTDANNQDMILGSNDNWQDNSAQATEIQNDGLAPGNTLESAIVLTLPPGKYTALLRDKNGATGLGLVEFYDVEPNKLTAKVANLSTRGFVDTGDNVMIGGFIVGSDAIPVRPDLPNGSAATINVIIRGIGPSLPSSIANRLQDPFLTLHDPNGNIIASNDDWQSDPTQASKIQAANLAPTNPKESAIYTTLAPGPYTAILRGTNNTTGVGLIEIYRQ
ncbi:MAG: beta strand repeat-containing protein [Chthoniobacterales bacterium]